MADCLRGAHYLLNRAVMFSFTPISREVHHHLRVDAYSLEGRKMHASSMPVAICSLTVAFFSDTYRGRRLISLASIAQSRRPLFVNQVRFLTHLVWTLIDTVHALFIPSVLARSSFLLRIH